MTCACTLVPRSHGRFRIVTAAPAEVLHLGDCLDLEVSIALRFPNSQHLPTRAADKGPDSLHEFDHNPANGQPMSPAEHKSAAVERGAHELERRRPVCIFLPRLVVLLLSPRRCHAIRRHALGVATGRYRPAPGWRSCCGTRTGRAATPPRSSFRLSLADGAAVQPQAAHQSMLCASAGQCDESGQSVDDPTQCRRCSAKYSSNKRARVLKDLHIYL